MILFVILDGQVVKTDTNNILIRALQLSKQKSEAKDVSCKTPGESSRGKRSAARSLDTKNPSKRPNTGNSAGSSTHGAIGWLYPRPARLPPCSAPVIGCLHDESSQACRMQKWQLSQALEKRE
ncbi:hypothetical protein PR202_ga31151 [Eleusine coracana subsp. coracana]|uniref:Uncharacterized protein n=1 Tax=Eleusine coracana subsp. coracana TaxID=191504 RepID=A0AAV5DRV4_ELECO|nr:hypothetical protein PR202_ga31151 [Eleusine coracana subsp. coracana]